MRATGAAIGNETRHGLALSFINDNAAHKFETELLQAAEPSHKCRRRAEI